MSMNNGDILAMCLHFFLLAIKRFDLGLFPFKSFLYYFDQLHFAEILKFV